HWSTSTKRLFDRECGSGGGGDRRDTDRRRSAALDGLQKRVDRSVEPLVLSTEPVFGRRPAAGDAKLAKIIEHRGRVGAEHLDTLLVHRCVAVGEVVDVGDGPVSKSDDDADGIERRSAAERVSEYLLRQVGRDERAEVDKMAHLPDDPSAALA